ncbi:alpha/beta hydrolase [Pseudanabaena yagii]|uniref:Alpha/beta hydrolase n=1 Tax=Pseudanabaena yagii GIHE-NHR1 TaxID=2722753 RepID=A0ABX1LVC4_9CYAN|nr:alpha/beta hydrolase [Pseudanabaena yagii]NMF60112.1 alpha/beta hydrolase [Pseudanabaena yagii GIHE-NHR1]
MTEYNLFKIGIFTTGALLVIIYIAACIFLLIRQRQMIFTPTYDESQENSLKLYLDYEEVWITLDSNYSTQDKLHGYFIYPEKDILEIGTILYLHGSGGNISDHIYLRDVAQLKKLGFSVFLFDYRGYGKSIGNFPSEMSIYADAQTALKYLTEQKITPLKSIYLFGVSLGGAVAIDLALKEPNVAGLIVVSTFTSMQEEIYHLGYRMFPIHLILNQRFESISKVPYLKTPVMFIHGTSDTFNPSIMSQKLYTAAPEPKQLLLIDNFGHNNISEMIETAQFKNGIQKFIQDINAKN